MHSNLLRFTETETPRIQRYPKFYKPNILIHDLLHQNTHVCSQATTQLVVAYNFGFVHGSEGEGGGGGDSENEDEMYLCASLNVPHTDGVIIRAGDELSPPRGAQRHGLDGTSVGAYQRAIVPATCIQEPNVTLQSEKHVYPRS